MIHLTNTVFVHLLLHFGEERSIPLLNLLVIYSETVINTLINWFLQLAKISSVHNSCSQFASNSSKMTFG